MDSVKIKFTVNQHWCLAKEGGKDRSGSAAGVIPTEFMSVNSGELLNSRRLDSFWE